MLGVVVQIDGFDPVLGQPVTLRTASHDDPAVCHVDGGEPWWPALIKLPTLRYDLFDGAFNAEITAPSSSLTIAAEPWPNLGRYALADARLQLWTGEVGAAWGAWTLRFDGRVSEQPELADGVATINFAVDDRWLDTALLTTYAGTSGPEGTEALKGQPKPLALGAPRYVAGTMIDNINNVFQLSAYGPLHGFEAGLERLARFGNTIGDFASYAALVAANVPAGRWATAKAVGMARLGAPPTGQISFLISGDEGGPNGWARRPGEIIRRLALLSKGAGRINDASLNALDAARPYNLSVNVEQQTTARQLIQQIAASVNAVAGMSWTGQLFVVPVGIGAPGMTLAADGSALPPVASVKQIGIASPFQKLAIGAARAWTVHALSDIAFTATLVDLGTYVEGTTYREGNIVSLADGSRWLYVNAAAGAGYAPPAGTAGDSYWSNLSAPIVGLPTYADGTPIDDLKPAEPGATNGAPPGSPVGNMLAEEVARLIPLNGKNILGQVLRGDALAALTDARTMLDGKTIGTVVGETREQQVSDSRAFAQNFEFMGARNGANDGWIFDAETIDLGTSDGRISKLSALVATINGVDLSIQDFKEIFYDESGEGLRSLMTMTRDGAITGIVNTLTGEGGDLLFLANRMRAVSTSGGQSIQIFGYGDDGVLEIPNARIKNLDVGVVTIANMAAGFSNAMRFTHADTPIGPAEVTLLETVLFDVGDSLQNGSALATFNMTHDGTAVVDAAATLRVYADVGQGYALVYTTLSGTQTQSGDTRWSSPLSFTTSLSAMGKARLKLTGQGYSLGGGPTSGSVARNVTVDILKIGR